MKTPSFSVAKFSALMLCLGGVLNAAEPAGKTSFNVRDYGAVGDGKKSRQPGD